MVGHSRRRVTAVVLRGDATWRIAIALPDMNKPKLASCPVPHARALPLASQVRPERGSRAESTASIVCALAGAIFLVQAVLSSGDWLSRSRSLISAMAPGRLAYLLASCPVRSILVGLLLAGAIFALARAVASVKPRRATRSSQRPR